MTLLETLALLTLLATVDFGMFDIAYKIFNNKKQSPSVSKPERSFRFSLKPERSFFVIDQPERC